MVNGTNYEVPHCGAFSTPHYPSWAQIFGSASCFQISLACRPLNVRDHVSQPYSTTGNIIVLYVLIFKFSEVEKTTSSFPRIVFSVFRIMRSDLQPIARHKQNNYTFSIR